MVALEWWVWILAGETRAGNGESEMQGFFPFDKLRVGNDSV